jgi:hypothetical protein
MKKRTQYLLMIMFLAGSLAPLARPAQPASAGRLQLSNPPRWYYVPSLFLNYTSSQYGIVNGVIVDATNSSKPLAGASVCINLHCVTSNTQGTFYLSDVPVSDLQTLTVNPNDIAYASYSQQVQTAYNAPLYLVISLSPRIITPGWIRIILSWSVQGDLDAHLWWLPTLPPVRHVYYNFHGDCDAYACLQNDSIAFGPETLSVKPGLDGSLSFAVARNIYPGEQNKEITGYHALVQVYDYSGLIGSFPAPTTGIGSVWYVFDLTWNTSNPLGPSYAITVQNKILNSLPH